MQRPLTFEQFQTERCRTVPCHQCNEINHRRPSRLCHACLQPYHLRCGKLTKKVSSEIPHWKCATCRNGNNNAGDQNVPPNDDIIGELPNLIGTWKQNIRVLLKVPKGARVAAAEAYCTLVDQVTEVNSIFSWARLFGFAFSALRRPSKAPSGEANQPSLTTIVRNQINHYMAAPILPPSDDANNNSAGRHDSNEVSLAKRVSAKLADCDIKGAVRIIASQDSFAGYDEGVTRALQAKHPPAPDGVALPAAPDAATPPFQATKEQVFEALNSFQNSSGSGPDGIRPGHLVSLTSKGSGAAGERLKTALTNLCNFVISGRVHERIRPLFYGASLCALAKKDGGIRPIAVGNALRRLATKVVLRPVTTELRDQLQPTQLGVGTPTGCEAALRATRAYIEGTTTPKVILKIDLKNAFNTLRRDTILTAVRENLPEAYCLFYQAYGANTILYHGNNTIPSATGLQQGDPAGPALFSLSIDDLTKSLSSELNVWFLDDGTLGDLVDKVLNDLDRLLIGFPALGAELNDAKCELTLLNHTEDQQAEVIELFRRRLPSIKIIPLEDLDLLGSPLQDDAVPRMLEEKRETLERLCSRLEQIDAHPALILLKNCFSLPKLMYVLRTSTAFKFPEHLKSIDESIRSSLTCITNADISNEAWHQAQLPVRHGGLGIRTSEHLSASAFLASHYATEDLVARILTPVNLDRRPDPEDALACWQRRVPESLPPIDKAKQKAWDEAICKRQFDELLMQADQISRARLLAARVEDSGAWLHALPTPTLGTLLDDECLRITVALRVGAQICQQHRCRCGAMVDTLGHHPLSCRYSAGRLPRHAALNDVVKRALTTAGIPSYLEPAGLDRGDGRRPDGMTVFPFKNGKPLVWDATCSDTFAACNINHSALQPAHAANTAETNKQQKYQNLTDRYIFHPIAVETSGVLGNTTRTFLKELGRRMTSETGDIREGTWLRQRISFAVARGNAQCIIASAKHV